MFNCDGVDKRLLELVVPEGITLRSAVPMWGWEKETNEQVNLNIKDLFIDSTGDTNLQQLFELLSQKIDLMFNEHNAEARYMFIEGVELDQANDTISFIYGT